MDCKNIVDLASEYLDQKLPDKERRAVEAHLEHCSACCLVYEDLRKIVTELSSLPGLEPSALLWPKLKVRVKEEAVGGAGKTSLIDLWKALRTFGPARRSLALASPLALLFIIGLALYFTPTLRQTEKTAEQAALAEIRQAENHYQNAINSLTQVLTRNKSSWDPQLAEVFEVNLGRIDQAIADCQEAVKKYPGNAEAATFLLAAYSRKVEFLQEILQIRS